MRTNLFIGGCLLLSALNSQAFSSGTRGGGNPHVLQSAAGNIRDLVDIDQERKKNEQLVNELEGMSDKDFLSSSIFRNIQRRDVGFENDPLVTDEEQTKNRMAIARDIQEWAKWTKMFYTFFYYSSYPFESSVFKTLTPSQVAATLDKALKDAHTEKGNPLFTVQPEIIWGSERLLFVSDPQAGAIEVNDNYWRDIFLPRTYLIKENVPWQNNFEMQKYIAFLNRQAASVISTLLHEVFVIRRIEGSQTYIESAQFAKAVENFISNSKAVSYLEENRRINPVYQFLGFHQGRGCPVANVQKLQVLAQKDLGSKKVSSQAALAHALRSWTAAVEPLVRARKSNAEEKAKWMQKVFSPGLRSYLYSDDMIFRITANYKTANNIEYIASDVSEIYQSIKNLSVACKAF